MKVYKFLKQKKALITATMAFLCLSGFTTALPVYAVNQGEALHDIYSGTIDTTKVETWLQGSIPADNRYLKAGTSSDTVNAGGCSYFAAAYMLLKMGKLDLLSGESPSTVIDKMEAIQGWITFGKMDFNRIGEAFPGVTCREYKTVLPGNTNEEKIALIKQRIDEGYFVILTIAGNTTNGHYIFVDSVTDDGDMIIGDSGANGTKWSDTHGPSGDNIIDYSLFQCENVVPNECPSIYKIKKLLLIEASRQHKDTPMVKCTQVNDPSAQQAT